jgi:uncharacterized protein (TIRG00374 family)
MIVQSLLGVGLLVAWLLMVDLQMVAATLRQAKWFPVLLAAGLMISSGMVRVLRWRIVLRPICWPPYMELWFINSVAGLVNFVIPLRTAEVAKSVLLKQKRRIPIAASLPTVAIDRVLDLVAVLALGASGAVLGVRLGEDLLGVFMMGGVLLLGFVALVVVANRASLRVTAIAGRILPRRMKEATRRKIIRSVELGLQIFTRVGRQRRDLILLLGLSLFAALLDVAAFALLFASLGFALPPEVAVTGYSLFMLTVLVPAAPGYVGSMEAFGSLVFVALGVGKEMAASAILLNHALTAVLLGATGSLGLWLLRARGKAMVRSVVTMEEATPASAPATAEV